jgi:hypothetical protein
MALGYDTKHHNERLVLMTSEPHGEDLVVHYASLKRRAAALNRLLSTPTSKPLPKTIIAMHLKILLLAGIGYCGAELRDWWLGWLDQRVRLYAGLCQSCGRPRNQDNSLCDPCIEECKQMDFESDEPMGGVN